MTVLIAEVRMFRQIIKVLLLHTATVKASQSQCTADSVASVLQDNPQESSPCSHKDTASNSMKVLKKQLELSQSKVKALRAKWQVTVVPMVSIWFFPGSPSCV